MYNYDNLCSICNSFIRLFWSKNPWVHCAAGRENSMVKTESHVDLVTAQVVFQLYSKLLFGYNNLIKFVLSHTFSFLLQWQFLSQCHSCGQICMKTQFQKQALAEMTVKSRFGTKNKNFCCTQHKLNSNHLHHTVLGAAISEKEKFQNQNYLKG